MITSKFILPGENYDDAREVRIAVFCDEQGYSVADEFDEHDETCHHLVIYDDKKAVACGRIFENSGGNHDFSPGRVAVLRSYRSRHLGARIMNELMEKAKQLGAESFSLGAQTYAVPFYEKFGFAPYGVEYMDGHIPHTHMAKNLVFDGCEWLEFKKDAEAVRFRRSFTACEVKSASIDITSLGFFELYINGERISEDLNVPAWSDYEKRPLDKINMPIFDTLSHRIYYLNYDITHSLRDGENVLGVHIGNGWYAQHESRNEGFTRCGQLKLCYKITIETKSGEKLCFVSDKNGCFDTGEITRTNIYFGETHDMRLAKNGCFEPCFDCSDWEKHYSVPAPKSLICKQECPSDKVIRLIEPKCIREFGDCKTYDLGEAVSGYAVLRFSNKRRDDTVFVRYADWLFEDGSLDFESTGGTARMQRDVFINDGDYEGELYPRFTWHAARYFEVLGNAEVIEFRVVHSEIECISEFESSNETLNWIYNAYIRTQSNNIHCCVPSDCPHRERLGYTGDGQITVRSVLTNYDAKAMYRKWMQDIADCQDRYNGHVQHTAPFYGGGGGPGGWGGAIAIVPWNYYLFTGEIDILEKYYPHIIKYLHYLDLRSENGLVVREEDFGWCLGDWNPPGNKLIISEPFVNTYYFVKCLEIANKVAEILGTDSDKSFIDEKTASCKEALMSNFFDKDSGSFFGGAQAADAFMYDIALGDERLLGNIVKRYNELGHYDTGIFGTDILTKTLFRSGNASLAYKLLTSAHEISFDFMRRSGATTLWEEWSGRNSKNHPMFGSVVEYFFTDILGIRQKEGSFNWSDYEIKPAEIPELEWARGSIRTPNGIIKAGY